MKHILELAAAALLCAACAAAPDSASQTSTTASTQLSMALTAASVTGTLLCAPIQSQLDACSGKAAGDACALTAADGGVSIAGTCRTTVDGAAVACAPTPPAPPQAEIDACSGKAIGAACSTAEADGDVETGVCATARDGVTVACIHVRTPPQAAIDACSGLTAGASCTMPSRHDGGTVTGTCTNGPTGAGPLACGRPHGVLVDATAACANLAAGAACTIGDDRRGISGTCETPADGSAALCVVSCSAAGAGFCGDGDREHH